MRLAFVLALAACGRLHFDPQHDGGSDAGVDADEFRCDPMAPFTSIQPITELNSAFSFEGGMRPAPDELSAYFHGNNGVSALAIMFTTRGGRDVPWQTPTVAIPSSADIGSPTLSPDGLTLVYNNDSDLLQTTRATTTDAFSAGTPIGPLSTAVQETGAYIEASHMYFTRHTGPDGIFVAPFPALDSDVQVATSFSGDVVAPVVSPDELVMYFAGRTTDLDIYIAQRGSPTDPFGPAMQVAELAAVGDETPTWLSPDLCRLYFESIRGGDSDIWLADRTP